MEIPDLSGMGLPEKEQKILEAAIGVFSEKGFSAATTSEIARHAGVAEGTIFRYFKTKKDILRGILIQTINLLSSKIVLDGVEKILKASDSKDMKWILKEILYDRLKLVDSIFPMARVIFTEALLHEDVRQAIYENIISRALEMFKEFHMKMAERGLLRKDMDSVVLFRSILGNLGIFIMQRKLFADVLPIKDVDEEFDQMVDILLKGIC